jgi:DNA-binding PadR family transcriptional regulator
MYTIFDLCSKETNVYTISNEIKIAYNNALNRLKKYEKQGFLIKSKIKGKNNRGVQTIYKLTPNGKKAYKIIKEFYTEIYDEKGNNISHLISKCNIY